jgi:hypothetical protein
MWEPVDDNVHEELATLFGWMTNMFLCVRNLSSPAAADRGTKGLWITGTHKTGIHSLSSREHNMRRVLRGLVLRDRKSQRRQVKTGKQCFALTEGNRRKSKMEGID